MNSIIPMRELANKEVFMKISTRGKNAIKLMLDLATYNHGEPVRLKDIAKRQNISESIRGAHGGYVLNHPPEKYTVGQILKAVEGDMSPTDCVGENGTLCENKGTCVSYRLWEKLDTAINDVLEGITLADMLEWQNELLIDQYVI